MSAYELDYFILYTGIFMFGMLTGMIYILIAQEWQKNATPKMRKIRKRRRIEGS